MQTKSALVRYAISSKEVHLTSGTYTALFADLGIDTSLWGPKRPKKIIGGLKFRVCPKRPKKIIGGLKFRVCH